MPDASFHDIYRAGERPSSGSAEHPLAQMQANLAEIDHLLGLQRDTNPALLRRRRELGRRVDELERQNEGLASIAADLQRKAMERLAATAGPELARLRWVERQVAELAVDLGNGGGEGPVPAVEAARHAGQQLSDILKASREPGRQPETRTGHELSRQQISKHGRDRFPSAELQMLQLVSEIGELAKEIARGVADAARVRAEYADAGLSLFALGDKIDADLIGCMAQVVDNDARDFRPRSGA
jgi:cell division septum initiation protein DivIVA